MTWTGPFAKVIATFAEGIARLFMKKSSKKHHHHIYWILLGSLAVVCLIIIGMIRSYSPEDVNARYLRPFEGKVQAAHEAGRFTPESDSPRSPGMRESDIQKRRGNRYETY